MAMKEFHLKYGSGKVNFSLPEEDVLGLIESSPVPGAPTEEEAVRLALANPIGSPRLDKIVKPGERVCIVTCDVTRAWQHGSLYSPILVEELTTAGIRDEDMLFISATGTHRTQTEDEYKQLISEDLLKRIKIMDHVCTDSENMVYLGTTSHGTPVKVNKKIMEYDHVIITGGIVYHFMAGWGGGRKAILPGISSYETVMANHALALDPTPGKGRNLNVSTGNFKDNILHEDMVEAMNMVKPSFLLNVVLDSHGKIGWAVAGDPYEAHVAGTKIVDSVDGVPISEKADLVIATAGGFPKDINLYQGSKTIFNAWDAVKDGGSMVIITTCSEGFGNDEVKFMLQGFDSMEAREAEIRREFTIAKYVGYVIADIAENHDFYLLSSIPASEFAGTGIQVVASVDEALEKIYAKRGRKLSTWVMPMGSSTRPSVR